MEINTSTLDEITAVAVKGRVDSTSANGLKDQLGEIIRSGSTRVVIDLKDVSYISSAGFRTLLITARTVEQVSGRLVLCGLAAEVRRLFDIAAFTELFTILANRDEAVNALRNQSKA